MSGTAAHSHFPRRSQSDSVSGLIDAVLPRIIAIRHDLHAHPELAYQEHRTASVVAQELTNLGIEHITGLAGGTGILAYLPPIGHARSQLGTRSIALRADMDALPIVENTGKPYASTTPGVMHACGHDGHTANLLGVAHVLSQLDVRPNPVHLIFQPAEEGGAGGKRMCDDGCLDGTRLGPPVGRIFGLHGWPQYELGIVGSRPGPLLAATDTFRVTITGEQAHAAYPHLGRDPIVAAAAVITALQTIVSRNVPPLESIVVSVTTIHAGTAPNIIPRSLELSGTVRTLTPQIHELARRRIREIVSGIVGSMGCHAEAQFLDGYPVTFNDPGATADFMRIAAHTLGESSVRTLEQPTMGGEDFSYYGQHVPACFFILGVKPHDASSYPSLHQPEYDFNDDALRTGIRVMINLALDTSFS